MDGVLLYDKPAGITSHDVVARVRRALPRGSRSATPARSTRSPPGCCSCCVGRATRVQRFLMALPKTYVATARFGAVSSTGDPEGEIVDTGAIPTGRSSCPPGSCASGRRRTRRSRSAGAGPTRWRARESRSSWQSARSRSTASRRCWRDGDRRGVRDRVLVGNLRAQPDRRSRRRLLRSAAPHRGSARSTSPTPIPSGVIALERGAGVHARGPARAGTAPGGPATGSRCRSRRGRAAGPAESCG